MSRDERSFEAGLTSESEPPDNGPPGGPLDGVPLGAVATSAIGSAPLELLGLLPNSSNYTFLVRAVPGGGPAPGGEAAPIGEAAPDREPVLAVYKPHRGESPLWDFAEGSLGRREVAAFVVAQALGWPNVPPTLLREGPEGPGSVQLFVPFEPREHYFTLQQRFAHEFRAVAAFDLVVNNADRKGGHCLLGEDGLLWVIDHGVCFHQEPKLRTVIWEYVNEPIPRALVDDIASLGARLASGHQPCQELDNLLDAAEVQALAGRIDAILARPVYPAPNGDRPYPWPPV